MSTEATLMLIHWGVIVQVVVLFFWARRVTDRIDFLSTQIMELSDLLNAEHQPVEKDDASDANGVP